MNLGVNGIDSYSIKQRLRQSLKAAPVKPALVVFYMGHNEFNNAYDSVIKKGFPDFAYLLKPLYVVSPKQQERIIAPMAYRWFSRLKRPALIEALQRAHVVTVRDSLRPQYDQVILRHFEMNLAEMLDGLAAAGIPALIVTPIGNYSARPFGSASAVDDPYRHGMAEPEYQKRMSWLIRAKDNELLTYDIRAKSVLTSSVMALRRKGVAMINLEAECLADGFRFDDSNFLDYFHLKSSGHQMIAQKISARILNEPELRPH